MPQPETSQALRIHRGGDVPAAPLVSVIIPAWNSEFVGRAVESVLAQTWRDFELLVIDDGSAEPVEVPRAERVVLVRQPNAGPGAARNLGLRLARGRLVAFLDSDDTWHAEKLARQVAGHLARPNRVLSTTDVVLRDAAGRVVRQASQTYRYRGEAISFGLLFYENCIATSAAMAQRSALLAAGGFDTSRRHAEDYALWLRVGLLGEVGYVDEVLCERTEQAGSLMQTGRVAGQWHAAELQVYEEFLAAHPELRGMAFVREGLARAEFDAGYGHLLTQHWSTAREAFAASLRLRWLQPRVWLNWLRAVRQRAPQR